MCEQAIFVRHDLRVDYITEQQLYLYSMNSTIQCSYLNPWMAWKVILFPPMNKVL